MSQQENNVTVVQQRGGFRKFLMRISEKIGATEKTEYTKCFQDMCKEVDEYRVSMNNWDYINLVILVISVGEACNYSSQSSILPSNFVHF